MFDSLSTRLTAIFDRLGGHGRLTEENIQEALREVRVALLEADVNFKVVRGFVERVREKAVGQDVLKSLTPAQQVVKVVHDELVELLGGSGHRLATAPHPPTVVMLIGLQGSGKTTTAAKLARMYAKQGQHPLLALPTPTGRPHRSSCGRSAPSSMFPSSAPPARIRWPSAARLSRRPPGAG
jgi:signal recognition particle subunit SRP54